MKQRQRTAWSTLIALCVLTIQASAAVIQFDLGHNTQTTADAGWNNMTGGNGAIPGDVTDAIDSTGAATSIDLSYAEFGGTDCGIAGTARNYGGPYPAAVSAMPESALKDVLFSRDHAIQLTLSDLNPAYTYTIMIYGSTNLEGLSQYTVTGAGAAITNSIYTLNNDDEVALFEGIAPNASNQITIDFAADNSLDDGIDRGFAAMNVLTVTEVIPEPGTLGLITACGGGLLLIRRRFMM